MNKVVLITGTRKGIGLQLAQHYIGLGHKVVGCSRGRQSLEHESYSHFELDVSNENQVAKMVREVKRAQGRIDILINNAGVAAMNHLITTPYESAKALIFTNVLGTFLLTREVAKVMIKQRAGHIVNFSTVAVPLNLEGEAIYAASKSAVETFTRVSAKELAPFGITVNAVGPTPIPTDLIRNVPEGKLNALINQQTLKRYGEFKDVLNVVEFFTSENSGFITGQVVYLGGVMGK